MKKLFFIFVLALGVFASILLTRTARTTSKQIQPIVAPEIRLRENHLADRFAKSLRFQTISDRRPGGFPEKEFLDLHQYLEHIFPQVHATLAKEVVGDYSLLYTWNGSDPALKPLLFMAHMDVVPVEPETEANWTHPPFSGSIADGYIWGRGAMDDKLGVLAIFEAVENLLTEKFQPRPTIYLAFGHDEEVGGLRGAARIATLLSSRGVTLEYVLDEGGMITEGILPGVRSPVALVGIAEKGYVSLELTVESLGGHSSMPPRQTAIGILSAAIHRLESSPFPTRIDGPTKALLETVGPEMALEQRLVMANLWLFGSLVERRIAASPWGDALMRTTMAATMFEGGVQENVLPSKARAVVNVRILPGDNTNSVTDRVRRTIADPRITIMPSGLTIEPSSVSDTDSPAYNILQKTIRQIFPGVIVAPWLLVAATDSRHYAGLTDKLYRFTPLRLKPEDISRIHGIDERVAVTNYADCVRFYLQVIRNSHT